KGVEPYRGGHGGLALRFRETRALSARQRRQERRRTLTFETLKHGKDLWEDLRGGRQDWRHILDDERPQRDHDLGAGFGVAPLRQTQRAQDEAGVEQERGIVGARRERVRALDWVGCQSWLSLAQPRQAERESFTRPAGWL